MGKIKHKTAPILPGLFNDAFFFFLSGNWAAMVEGDAKLENEVKLDFVLLT